MVSTIITKIVQPSLIPQTNTYFIDGSSNCRGGIHPPINTSFSLSQQVQLAVLIYLFWFVHKPLYIVSSSVYVVGLFPVIETA